MYPILYDVCNNCGLNKNSSDISCETNQTVQWIYKVFHECVNNSKEEAGFILGLVSILCWICASVPQLYENYKRKKVEEALSFLFLIFWLLGDTCNLEHGDVNTNWTDPSLKHVIPCCFMMIFLPLSLIGRGGQARSVPGFEHHRIGRILLSKVEHGGSVIPTDTEDVAGYAIGCVSSLFYLCSRLPQIIKNILLQDPAPGQTYLQFIMQHLPWLIGSLGTMSLDFFALSQILYFNPPCCKDAEETEEDGERLIA